MDTKLPTDPNYERPLTQAPVANLSKAAQFESDKRDLKTAIGKNASVHVNYSYFLSTAMLLDLKDPLRPFNDDGTANYRTYIAIRGDDNYFNFYDTERYQLWEAINAAMTLVDCVNCFNCEMCVGCKNLVDGRLCVESKSLQPSSQAAPAQYQSPSTATDINALSTYSY